MKEKNLKIATVTVDSKFEEILVDYLALNGFKDQEIVELDDEISQITIYNYEKNSDQLKNLLNTFKNLVPDFDYVLDFAVMEYTPWYEIWKKTYKPVEIGNKFLVGPPGKVKPKKGFLTIKIEPANAFGSGYHETTALMLEFLEGLNLVGKSVLDVGCGTGILSIASEFLGAGSVLGFDIDFDAAVSTRQNIALNGCNVMFFQGTVHAVLKEFDVILANILFNTLMKEAKSIAKRTKKGGILLLSGLLKGEEKEIIDHYQKMGFVFSDMKEKNGWVALLFSKGKIGEI